jgi:MFS family permease
MTRLHKDPAAPQASYLEDSTKRLATIPPEESLQENAKSSGGFMTAARSKALRPFVIISSSYLLFTITDGAIRLIVLLHAYNKKFSALEVSIMFSLYELAGVFTNLAAGLMGAKWGIKFTLIIGLSLQLLSYGLMFGWQDSWTKAEAMIYVTGKFNHVTTAMAVFMLECRIFNILCEV